MQDSKLPKFFADTSSILEIEQLREFIPIHGITTNPIIVATEAGKTNVMNYYKNLAERFPDLPISIQLLDEDEETLIKQAHRYASIAPNIVVKVPMFEDGRGLKLISQLTKVGVAINVTALMTAEQLLLAWLAGSNSQNRGPSYLSLFFNRIKDGGGNPKAEIRKSRALLDQFNSGSQIIIGSVRKPEDVRVAISAGAHIVTVTPGVFWKMIPHPKSTEFIRQSQAAWEEITRERGSSNATTKPKRRKSSKRRARNHTNPRRKR